MEPSPLSVSTCRFCAHYDPQGRRGGECRKLGVPVRGYWRACPLALAAFSREHPDPTPVSSIPSVMISSVPMTK